MKRTHGIIAIALVAGAAGLTIWLRTCAKSKRANAGAAAMSDARTAGSGAGLETADPVEPDDGTGEPDDGRYRVIDADARMALMHRIEAARAARQAGKPAPPEAAATADDPAPLPGELTADQILDGIMPVMPLLKECYEAGLDRRTVTSGKVTFKLHLAGEPEIGTLVDHAELDGDPAFLADAELAQCLHETMMSLELPPMSQGAELDVTTAMQFTPD